MPFLVSEVRALLSVRAVTHCFPPPCPSQSGPVHGASCDGWKGAFLAFMARAGAGPEEAERRRCVLVQQGGSF